MEEESRGHTERLLTAGVQSREEMVVGGLGGDGRVIVNVNGGQMGVQRGWKLSEAFVALEGQHSVAQLTSYRACEA